MTFSKQIAPFTFIVTKVRLRSSSSWEREIASHSFGVNSQLLFHVPPWLALICYYPTSPPPPGTHALHGELALCKYTHTGLNCFAFFTQHIQQTHHALNPDQILTQDTYQWKLLSPTSEWQYWSKYCQEFISEMKKIHFKKIFNQSFYCL